MKRGTQEHPKIKRLCRELGGAPLYHAAGILELLWLHTARFSARGDIGKWTNEDLATAVDWRGDPAELVRALVVSGWLDEDTEYRLVVHDWDKHADRSALKWCKDNHLAALHRGDKCAPSTEKCAQVRTSSDKCTSTEPEPEPEPAPEPEEETAPAASRAGGSPSPAKPKAPPKPKARDPHAEAFKAAFDATFPDAYVWTKADFSQLDRWRKNYPDATPERFVEVAEKQWGRGEFRPGASMSIKGLCSKWSEYAAFKTEEERNSPPMCSGPDFVMPSQEEIASMYEESDYDQDGNRKPDRPANYA